MGLPCSSSETPAEVTTTPEGPEAGTPAAVRRSMSTTSAMAERQILPVQTIEIV